jgi:hypothetical protein
MSTKTLRKRIALVAVSALGAGVLSVAPANAADGEALVSLIASTSGSAVASSTEASARQVGVVTMTNTAAVTSASLLTFSSGQAQTGLCLSTCSIPFELDRTSDTDGVSVVVVGGTLGSVSDTITLTNGSGVLTMASDRKSVVLAAGTTNSSLIGIATASSGATSMQLQFYKGSGITGLTTATAGTLTGSLTLTIASGSAAGVYSAAESTIATQVPYVKGTTASGVVTYDNTSRIANGSVGAIYVNLKDAYTTALTTGILTASATNGALVNINDGAPAAGHDYAAAATFDSETDVVGGDAYISVLQPVANTAGSTTVTITFNGEVVSTKTLNWNGDVASITVDTVNSASIFKNGAADSVAGTDAQRIYYVAKDAAGNAVSLSAAPTISSDSGALVGASLSTTVGTTYSLLQTSSLGYGYGTLLVPSSSLQGAGSYKLKVTNLLGTSIYSAEQKVTVSESSLDSFVASWDKASYAPGEIAVLTISGKDSKGNKIADGYAAAGLSITVAGSATAGFTAVGTACSASSTFSGGSFTCKYAANTEGAWSYSVDVTTGTPQSPSVGALKITAGGAVTNADVLKAIVSLIASINKQIAALQKALLRR